MLRNPAPHSVRGYSLQLAREYVASSRQKVAYVVRGQDVDRIAPPCATVCLIVATPGCLDGWTGPAVLDPALPAGIRETLAPIVGQLNRGVEAIRYRAAWDRGQRRGARVAG